MTTLTSFRTNSTWREITGVSEIEGEFTFTNTLSPTILLCHREIPSDDDAEPLMGIGYWASSSRAYFNNTVTIEKIWARSDSPSKISISKGT